MTADMVCRFGNLLSGARPILDREITETIRSMNISDLFDRSRSSSIVPDFLDSYDRWIRSSVLNRMIGFENYNRYMTFAVTNIIEQFLMKHRTKRIRTFQGEYPGTTKLIEGYGMEHCYLDDGILMTGDAVIMSSPFSSTGDMHPMIGVVLDECDSLDIPVMIDCAFFGICKGLHLQARKSIETVAFSLSKCYCLSDQRIGMVYSKDVPFAIELLHSVGYTSRFGAAMAMRLFDSFGPDYVYSKYSSAQMMVCDELGNLIPSNTVLFGNGDRSWNRFNRGGSYNRVCFSDFLPMLVS